MTRKVVQGVIDVDFLIVVIALAVLLCFGTII